MDTSRSVLAGFKYGSLLVTEINGLEVEFSNIETRLVWGVKAFGSTRDVTIWRTVWKRESGAQSPMNTVTKEY